MANKFGALVAGALGGAADAVQQEARGYIDDSRKVDVAGQLSQIEEQRQLRIEQAREQTRRGGKQFDSQFAREQAGPDALAFAQAKTQPEVLDANDTLELRSARSKAAASADPIVLKAGDTVASTTATRERAAVSAAGQDPEFLSATQAVTRAKQAPLQESQRSLAEAELARLSVDEKKAYDRTVEDLAALDAEPDSPSKQAKQKALTTKLTMYQMKARGPRGGAEDIAGAAALAANALKLAQAAESEGDLETAKKYRQRAAEINDAAAVKKLGAAARPGAPTAAPHPEGSRLQGPDGKIYVVRNGVPVPERAAAPAPSSTGGTPGLVDGAIPDYGQSQAY